MWIRNLTDEEASLVGSHQNAVGDFVRNNRSQALANFTHVSVAGHRLETRLPQLEAWAMTDELSYESIYEDPQ